eukprot:EG_transcript_15335
MASVAHLLQHRPLLGRGRDLRDLYCQRLRKDEPLCASTRMPGVMEASNAPEPVGRREDIVRSALRDRRASRSAAADGLPAPLNVCPPEGKAQGAPDVPCKVFAPRNNRPTFARRPSLPVRLATMVSTSRCPDAPGVADTDPLPDATEDAAAPPPPRSLWARRHSQPVRALDEIERQKQAEAQQEEVLLRRAQRLR